MRPVLGIGPKAGSRCVPAAMCLPFDVGDVRNWCCLGFQSTDTVKNSAGDGGSIDGRTIPENPFARSVSQPLFPFPSVLGEDKRRLLIIEDVKAGLCAVRSWKEVRPMPRHISCWHSHPSGTGAIARCNDVRSCVAFETRVRQLPSRRCLFLSHDSQLLIFRLSSIGFFGAAISLAVTSKSKCPLSVPSKGVGLE